MEATIACRDLGVDRHFVAAGLTRSESVAAIIRHAREKHIVDRFELEGIHAKARSQLRGTSVAGGGLSGDI